VIANISEREQRGANGFLDSFERTLSMKSGLVPRPIMQLPTTNSAMTNGLVFNRPRDFATTNGFPPGLTQRFGPNGPFGPRHPIGPNGPFQMANEAPVERIAGPTLVVDRFWRLSVPAERDEKIFGAGMDLPLLRDGKIWLRFSYNGTFTGVEYRIRSLIARLDAKTVSLETTIPLEKPEFEQTAPFFNPFNMPPRIFEALNGVLFALNGGFLMRKANDSAPWQKFTLPSAGGNLWRVGSKLYWLTDDALHEVDPDTGKTKTLASVRRRPPENGVDELDTLTGSKLAAAKGGALRFLHGNVTYTFDGATWKREPAIRDANWSVQDDVAFALASNLWNPIELSVARPDADGTEPVAHIYTPVRGGSGGMSATDGDFTAQILLAGKPFLLGTNVAILSPRGQGLTTHIETSDKTSQFDIFVFGPAGKRPVQIALNIDLSRGEPLGSRFGMPQLKPHIIVTENELLLGSRECAGFWRIPRSKIEEAIASALSQMPAQPVEEAKK
jgi:hypothetical protein